MSRYDGLPERELDKLRRALEKYDVIEEIDEETLALIERRWPWLLSKLKPRVLH
jgi:hypothetical protein